MKDRTVYKKFLCALYAGLMLFTLKTTSQAGFYTDAFEYEVEKVKCGSLTCHIIKSIKGNSYTSDQPVEVGHSIGPFGKTTHYQNKPVTTSWSYDWYKCDRCNYEMGRDLKWFFYPSVPKVTIKKNGNTRTMTVEGSSDLPLCGSPWVGGTPLMDILKKAGVNSYSMDWNGRLQLLWKTAKELDGDESGENLTSNNINPNRNETNTELPGSLL